MGVSIRRKQIERFADSIKYVFSLNLQKKEELTDEIFNKQPKLILELVGLKHLKIPYEKIEYIVHILLIFYDYFHQRGKKELPKITEKMINKANDNTTHMLRLIDIEGHDLTAKTAKTYPEPEALSFMAHYLKDNGFNQETRENEICIRTAKNILDCFVTVKKMENEQMGREN